MSLGLPLPAHSSIVAVEPNRWASTKADMTNPVPHLPAHRVQLGQRGVVGFQVVATGRIASATGIQSRTLARWTKRCAFVVVPPSVVVVESSRGRLDGNPRLLHEGGNARHRRIGSAWRLPSGSSDLQVL